MGVKVGKGRKGSEAGSLVELSNAARGCTRLIWRLGRGWRLRAGHCAQDPAADRRGGSGDGVKATGWMSC